MDVKELENITKNLTLLYTEDDNDLINESSRLFKHLYKSVTVASNGEEALSFYKKNSFDIVITDIVMPKLNGIELIQQIHKINPSQCIIVTSAYDDSKYLLQLIDLNINKFILKPLKAKQLVNVLAQASKHVINERLVDEYRKELEQSNALLKEKNSELEQLLRILDSKIEHSTAKQQEIAYEGTLLSTAQLTELKEIETDIKGTAVLLQLNDVPEIEHLKLLGSLIEEYSEILSFDTNLEELQLHIDTLGDALSNPNEQMKKRVQEVSLLVESFIYVLQKWRNALESNQAENPYEKFHDSMINDINTIISILENRANDVQTEIDFF